MTFPKSLSHAAVVVTMTVVLYVVVDAVFGLFVEIPPYASHPERLTAAAYQLESYFSEPFLRESFVQPGKWETKPGTRLLFPAEFHGKYFNADRLAPTGLVYRRTVNPAATSGKVGRILVLGGSSVYGSEVPDELTVASQFAAVLAARGMRGHEVMNAGVSSANSAQELERLKYELARGLQPSLVVSLGGFNDVWQGVYYGAPDETMFSDAKRNHLVEWLYRRIPKRIYRFVRSSTEATQQRTAPAHLADPVEVEKLVQSTAEGYMSNILEMGAILSARNVALLAFLQPTVVPELCDSNNSRELADTRETRFVYERRTPGADSVVRRGYIEMRSAIEQLQHRGVTAFDLSDSLCSRTAPVFLDMVHVNSHGNALIAEAMARHVLDAHGLSVQ
jgi:lysophospholipase L1-like esterase